MVRFTKMQSASQDFLVINNVEERIFPERFSDLAAHLCQRRISVGAEGVIFLCNPSKPDDSAVLSKPADIRTFIYDADGSRCGLNINGVMCAAKYFFDRGKRGFDPINVETDSGAVRIWPVTDSIFLIRVENIKIVEKRLTVQVEGSELECTYADVGREPYLVVEYDFRAKEESQLWLLANRLRYHSLLPRGANVIFYQILSDGKIETKAYKRGIEDFAASCGEGACAAVAVLIEKGLCRTGMMKVISAGGMLIAEGEVVGKPDMTILLTGEVTTVYQGTI